VNVVCKLFCKIQRDFGSTLFVVLIEALIEEQTTPEIRTAQSWKDMIELDEAILLSSSIADCQVR
jgi:hypothetical protein